MALPTLGSSRPLLRNCICGPYNNQVRHASLLRRPKRPYTFTQLIFLSDGSSYLHRTTSPAPVYRSTKDQRNTPLWNPSSQKLLNVEEDEAGRLRAFRQRFGRGWDAEATSELEDGQDGESQAAEDAHESLFDLISGYGQQTEAQTQTPSENASSAAKKGGKGKK